MTDSITIRPDAAPQSAGNWKFSFADMVSAIEQLVRLLEDENALLAGMQVAAIGPLQERKTQLTWLIDMQKEHLAKNPQLLQGLDVETRNHFMVLAATLENALTENHYRLTTARLINQKVVQAVTAALSDNYGEARGYGESGSRGISITKDTSTLPPLALNEMI